MKIGKFVKHHTKQIFAYCDDTNHQELYSLLDPSYSKKMFGINFPFCIELGKIEKDESKRYWTEIYLVRGKNVRVTSQWFPANHRAFMDYLETKGIKSEVELAVTSGDQKPPSNRSNSRYRGNAIGNAQNLFIRNILSSLGSESFNENDWNSTKSHFSNKCAYCGAEDQLHIEHAVPINKEKLGEHRLGNLVPSCKQCNSNKGDKNYSEFLKGNPAAIMAIEAYMDSRNYVPLEDNEQMKKILNLAYKEVAALADRYITMARLGNLWVDFDGSIVGDRIHD